MNYAEILSVLKEKEITVKELGHGDFDSNALGLGECKKDIHSEGGEGEGENWVRVHHFSDHDIYVSITGHYSSYNGTDFYGEWDCVSQVSPQQKTITVYE